MNKDSIANGVSESNKFLAIHLSEVNDMKMNKMFEKYTSTLLNIQAPPGCLQYYTGQTGTVESFNFRGTSRATPVQLPGQLPNQLQALPSPNYFNNMHYGICIHKLPKMCGIKWTAIEFDFGGLIQGMSSTEVQPPQTGVFSGCVLYDPLEDIGDYITIPGSSLNGRSSLLNRLCGQRLNPDTIDRNFNADVICE